MLRNPSSHLFIDCGDVGMRGRGGHGHNDILSFELFMNGANIVTDCGAFVYTASRDWRNRFRSTAFHNTIQVDDEEVNRFVEPNALWQLVDDAKPAEVRWGFGPSGDFWQGSHTGYQRLPQPSTPSRALWMDAERPVVAFKDGVAGTGRHRVRERWHLDPECQVTIHEGDCRISTGSKEIWMLPAEPATFTVEDGWVSKRYGVKTPSKVIVFDRDAELPFSLSYVFADTRLDFRARADALAALERAAISSKGE